MIEVAIKEFIFWVFTSGLCMGVVFGAAMGYALGRMK